jgi:hypothetical protein
VFAGKKSAQIREILISESAWEEMTCLFAPSLELISKEWSQLRAQYVRILVPGQSFPQGIPDQYIYATSFLNP